MQRITISGGADGRNDPKRTRLQAGFDKKNRSYLRKTCRVMWMINRLIIIRNQMDVTHGE